MITTNRGVHILGMNGAKIEGDTVWFRDQDFAEINISIMTIVRLIDIVKHEHENDFESFLTEIFNHTLKGGNNDDHT